MLNTSTQSNGNKRIHSYIRNIYLNTYGVVENVQNDGKIVKFQLDPKYMEQFLELVKGEIIECVEGCLLNNYLIYSKLGTIVMYEHYLNCWSSDLIVLIQESDRTELETTWWKFYDENVEE